MFSGGSKGNFGKKRINDVPARKTRLTIPKLNFTEQLFVPSLSEKIYLQNHCHKLFLFVFLPRKMILIYNTIREINASK